MLRLGERFAREGAINFIGFNRQLGRQRFGDKIK